MAGTLVDAFVKSHGVLSARFDVMGCVGWNGPAIRATSQSGSLREQATLFTNLLLSNNFKEIVQLALTDTDLQEKLSDLIDLDYLRSAEGDLYKASGWGARTRESRERSERRNIASLISLEPGSIFRGFLNTFAWIELCNGTKAEVIPLKSKELLRALFVRSLPTLGTANDRYRGSINRLIEAEKWLRNYPSVGARPWPCAV